MTKDRVARAEATVRHISERIQIENRSVLQRSGMMSRTRQSYTMQHSLLSPPPARCSTSTRTPACSPASNDDTDAMLRDGEQEYLQESATVVSAYLQQLVRDLLGQMKGASSAKHYDRHILLVEELLFREAIYGFTPSMVLAGLGDVMIVLAEALLDGNAVSPPHPTHGVTKSTSHRAAIAAAAQVHQAVDLAVPREGIEGFLPSHVKEPEAVQTHGTSMSDLFTSTRLSTVHGYSTSQSPCSEDVALVLKKKKRASIQLRHTEPRRLITVQDALYAMMEHCSSSLICVGLEDQQHMIPAMEELCSILSHIASTVITPSHIDPMSCELSVSDSLSYSDSAVGGETPRDKSSTSEKPLGGQQRTTKSAAHRSDASNMSQSRFLHGKLGGLTLEQHQKMTESIRLVALHSIESILSAYDRHIDTMEVSKEKERPTRVSHQSKVVTVDRQHVDTLTSAILKGIDLNRTTISEQLVARWTFILKSVPVTKVRATPSDEQDGTHAPLLDSARNVNAFTAEDAYLRDGEDSHTSDEGDIGFSTSGVHHAEHHPALNCETPFMIKEDDTRFRGVVGFGEEEEVAAILHIFIQLLTLSEYAAKVARGHKRAVGGGKLEDIEDVPLHPEVPNLICRTLARCAVGDYCSSLCMDLLWQAILSAPHLTSDTILYNAPEAPDVVHSSQLVLEAAAAENMFQSLINFLNNSHRQQQREMRNDIIVILSAVLRENTKRLLAVSQPATMAIPSPLHESIPLSVINAINAVAMVLFDLLCRPELSLEAATRLSQMSSSSAAQIAQEQGLSEFSAIAQQTLLAYAIRFHGAASTPLRRDNLQLKRVGWEFLEAFCEWQAVHVHFEQRMVNRMMERSKSLDHPVHHHGGSSTTAAATKEEDSHSHITVPTFLNMAEDAETHARTAATSEETIRRATLQSFRLVNLFHLGFLDVLLLLYCNVECKNKFVLEWTREELYTLQEEAWRLMGAMVRSAERNRQQFFTRDVLAEVEEVRRRLNSSVCTNEYGRQSDTTSPGPRDMSFSSSTNNVVRTGEDHSGEDGANQSSLEEGALRCDESNWYAADVYFIALDGVDVLLKYVATAPAEVERLKYKAINLLASVAQSGDPEVHRVLGGSYPGMVPFLTELLQTLLTQVNGSLGSRPVPARQHYPAAISCGETSGEELTTNSTILPPEQIHTLVISCFSVLDSIGCAARRHRATLGVQRVTPGGQRVTLSTPGRPTPQTPYSDSSSFSTTSESTEQEVPAAMVDFYRSNGIQQLVAWARYVLHPNALRTQAVKITALAQHPEPTQASRTPLMEDELFLHLDLLTVILSCIRSLVLRVRACEVLFLAEGGMASLLNTMEALAIASDALPEEFGGDYYCIRTRSIHSALPYGPDQLSLEQRRRLDFNKALKYALVVLSDALLSNSELAPHFLAWHSEFITKSHEVGFGAPRHEHVSDNYINATQLLLALWRKSTSVRSPTDPCYFNPQAEENANHLVIGIRVLNINLRNVALVSLRREYVRRLLRRRIEIVNEDERQRGVPQSSAYPLSVPELVNYYQYIFDLKTLNFSDEDVAQRMVELLNTNDEDAELIHYKLMDEILVNPLGLAVKVFSCLTAIGFEKLIDVSLTPAERAHLIGVASLPALATDEMCVAMAEVSRVKENLPWGPVDSNSSTNNSNDTQPEGGDGPEKSFVQVPAEDPEDVIGMRPTTPDRRCLSTLMDDVQARSHELRQLFEIGKASEASQLRELYNRYLITRLKQPVGVASLWEEYNDRNGTTSLTAYEQVDETAVKQPIVPFSPIHSDISGVSPMVSPTQSAGAAGQMRASAGTPSQLASSVSRKVVSEVQAASSAALKMSYPSNNYIPDQGTSDRCSEVSDSLEGTQIQSTPGAMAQNIFMYQSQVGKEGSTLPADISSMGGTKKHRVPALRASNVSDRIDLQVTWPERQKSSLAEKHLKKEKMIQNSLRMAGGVVAPKREVADSNSSIISVSLSRELVARSTVRAETLVDKVIMQENYAEPSPSYIFALEPGAEKPEKGFS